MRLTFSRMRDGNDGWYPTHLIEIKGNGNFSKLCNTQQLCENENKNYITNKKYLLKKICNDDECSYSLNCGCNKK